MTLSIRVTQQKRSDSATTLCRLHPSQDITFNFPKILRFLSELYFSKQPGYSTPPVT